MRSGTLGERVLMLTVADREHALAGMLSHHEFESVGTRVDGNEGGSSIIILSRGDSAFPLAEIEGRNSVVGQYGKVAELLAGIMPGQARNQVRRGRHNKTFPIFGELSFVTGGS